MDFIVGFLLLLLSIWMSVQAGSVMAVVWTARVQGNKIDVAATPMLSSVAAFYPEITGIKLLKPLTICAVLIVLAIIFGRLSLYFGVPLSASILGNLIFGIGSLCFWLFIFNRVS